MTATNETGVPAAEPSIVRRRAWPRSVARFAGAFAVGVAATLLLAGAAMFAYDARYDGRIVPGVRVGGTDLSGLDRAAAATALSAAYRGYGDGRLVIRTPVGETTIPFAEFMRGPDLDAMIDEAMGVGREGDPLQRAIAEARTAIRGSVLGPRLTLDPAVLSARVEAALMRLSLAPHDATIAMTPAGVVTTSARAGRSFDSGSVAAAAVEAASRIDAPSEIGIDAALTELAPAIDDADVLATRTRVERMIADLTVTDGKKAYTIKAATVRGWIAFPPPRDAIRSRTAEGPSLSPVVNEGAIARSLATVAKAIDRKPVSATFLTGKSGTVVGVTASVDGRTLDTAGTTAAIARSLSDRATGAQPAAVAAVVRTTQPKLTTAEARKVAPLMVRLSVWTTYFPIGERNHYGANIWLPAQFINGTVLAPGATFEWWRAVGPVTTARGFGAGGVIDGDHTDPTGAIGGGMCSSSTTLFNAALRAGLETGARANHSYYITRYPLGLDATVGGAGGKGNTMSFTNDMSTPVLIRGYKIVGSGGKGYVRYEIWGIPDGRKVSIGKPVVWNVQKATTRIVYVTTLAPGVRVQTEVPANGMDVSVTRVVRDKGGNVIHADTYRSHYRLWNGRIEVGAAR